MPPVSIFRGRKRLSGLEFACCIECNGGTKAADAIAALMSFVSRPENEKSWQAIEVQRLLSAADNLAPGFRTELLGDSSEAARWRYTRSGLLVRGYDANGSGPILKRHMDVFSAKLGMALYREHVGQALPLTGRVYSRWFLNGGLSDETANAILSILPVPETLRMGKQVATEQFAYRFNCDERSILAAMAGFHSNLHVLTFATSDPDTYGPVLTKMRDVHGLRGPWFDTMSPGELVQRLVKPVAS